VQSDLITYLAVVSACVVDKPKTANYFLSNLV